MTASSPDMLQDISSIAVVLGGDFEYNGRVAARDPVDDAWPALSVEARMRVTAFGIVACSGMVDGIRQVIFSGGIEAPGPEGELVSEADTMEHLFESVFSKDQREGIVVVKDSDCLTTRTSAESVSRLLTPDGDQTGPYLFVTSRAHAPRAEAEFQRRKGIPTLLLTAEQILLNAAEFGWSAERSGELGQQAETYMHSWRGRRMMVQEWAYRAISSSSLGDIAERRIIAHRVAA